MIWEVLDPSFRVEIHENPTPPLDILSGGMESSSLRIQKGDRLGGINQRQGKGTPSTKGLPLTILYYR